MKLSLWGVLFYVGWILLAVLSVLSFTGWLSKTWGDWLMILILIWPTIFLGLGGWDYNRGFDRTFEAERKQRSEEE